MASGWPARQLPAVLARRQPRVYNTCRRLQSTSASKTTTQNPAYPLYPSVIQLLHQKGIPETEVSKIPASGPKGRLLKGDVLAYIGTIGADYPSKQATQLEKLSHLDLSNIKIAAPAPAPEPKAEAAAAEAKEVEAAPAMSSVAVSVSLSAVLSVQYKLKKKLGTTIPISEFLARATELANEGLPRSKLEEKSAGELFDEILGAPAVTTSRGGYIPELNAVEIETSVETGKPVQEDIIDFLSGKKSAPKKTVAPEPDVGSAPNVFSLTVPVGEEKRARTFLERVKTLLQVDPGRLVL
ncbi:pyruvate dehydrogenase complex [Aspergillus sclerotialis]|uniref:Pyruvate dehydrogenase complex n=1 Tax=Aspergillus sclerotialis TaxID=2070753 RepID=A0A3A2ZN04_9EURO|nr:pyruvate dehydrogenase complex [Aspergillus sclerotialis]